MVGGARHGPRFAASVYAMEKKMYKHILIPTDGTALSKNAIDHGLALAKAVNARVTTGTVSRPYSTLVIEPDTITETPEDYKQPLRQMQQSTLPWRGMQHEYLV
jgi:nucleotide-binding universal stress UspA family protein